MKPTGQGIVFHELLIGLYLYFIISFCKVFIHGTTPTLKKKNLGKRYIKDIYCGDSSTILWQGHTDGSRKSYVKFIQRQYPGTQRL